MNSIKSSEYNPADNYDYPEFIAVSGKEDRKPDEGFDNLEEAKARADKIGGFVYQMINGEGVEIYSANESTTETTESEKATEIKEEFSENAYLQLINETTPVPMEFHGRYYNSAEEWKEYDPIAFRESYMAWIDGNEKDGVDTGDDGYESKATEDNKWNAQNIDQNFWDREMNIFDKMGVLRDIGHTLPNGKFTFNDLPEATQDAIRGFKTNYRVKGGLESGQVEPDENWNVGRWTSGKGLNEDMYADDDLKLDTEAEIDNYIKEGTDPAPYEEEDMPESIKSELKDEADEILAGLAINDELEGIKDTYGSSPNADPTTTPLEDHSGTDDSSDAQYSNESEDDDYADKEIKKKMDQDWDNYVERDVGGEDPDEDTVEESFGDCGCKDTKKARTTWESAKEGDKQYWLRNMGEDEGYSYYHFEHLPKRVGESLVDKFKIEESEDRGWSKIPALERTNLLRKLGFPPRDAELVANLEYPQLSESLKKDVNDAVIVKKRAEESQREKPDEQLAFENDLYSNMYDGFLKRRGERVDSKKNDKF